MGRYNGGRFYFPVHGCWKVKCLTAELARLTGIMKEMETRMTEETDGIKSDDRDKGRKEH